ncbi:uncharacterized protein A1O5_03714 [Cladophialophora psammophila CBS 110553]|uniref:Major facilitator superfamily (MFS) profile domain-containing protein n=1 Tax=Cladophialophora psammophila CBS 110553 TaxID=1182543 RepID=W9WX90_9EURO|nr:uncharacterized protein A1O5_03714 [Cladophialophora psammophila CBS 110553]EXJ72568.1 hypothetical protein A1O5_03714 [Cladophialophora psammophila CBS 110553]
MGESKDAIPSGNAEKIGPICSTEAFLVDWEGDDDATNPLNWSRKAKAIITILVSCLSLLTPLASSMLAPGVQQLVTDFDIHSEFLITLVISIYLIGYAVGPLVCAPMSELYGRQVVYHITNVLFTIFTIACALAPNLNILIGFRFLAGAAGSAPLVLGSGVITDIYPRERRGSKLSTFAMGPLLGPVIDPIAGAFLCQKMRWRWVFWVLTIAAGVMTLLCFAFLKETYAPVLLERKAARLRKTSGDSNSRQALWSALIRPTKMFFLSPIVPLFCIYIGIVYGYMYILFTTFTEVYEHVYNFSAGIAGVPFIGIGLGMFGGLWVFSATSDRLIRREMGKGNVPQPEVRLQGMLPAAICIPIGLFWYGWSAEKGVHWIMPILGTVWIGYGIIGIFIAAQAYLIDCYPRYAASVAGVITVVRSALGAFLPLAGRPLYAKLGLGWGNSALGFVALAMVPLPLALVHIGERLRTSPRFQISL